MHDPMKPDVVVDIGNSRMKWGLLHDGTIAETVSLGRYPTVEWQKHFDAWQIEPGSTWLIASVDPGRLDGFTRWLTDNSQIPAVVRSQRQIPLTLDVETPEGVGIDRLLACLGALKASPYPAPFLVVQAGTAIVVNFINVSGVFLGGAILPGFAMMAKALRDHTAALPEVPIRDVASLAPGRNTEQAIQLGIFAAAVGTIQTLRERPGLSPLPVVLTGGDAELLLPHLPEPVNFLPDLVLAGLVKVSAKLP
jgi:type III pantothenate kinase